MDFKIFEDGISKSGNDLSVGLNFAQDIYFHSISIAKIETATGIS